MYCKSTEPMEYPWVAFAMCGAAPATGKMLAGAGAQEGVVEIDEAALAALLALLARITVPLIIFSHTLNILGCI